MHLTSADRKGLCEGRASSSASVRGGALMRTSRENGRSIVTSSAALAVITSSWAMHMVPSCQPSTRWRSRCLQCCLRMLYGCRLGRTACSRPPVQQHAHTWVGM